MKNPFLLLPLLSLLWPVTPAVASQNRVDSTGGLSLVLQDETTEVNPYNFGDPAGLVFLPQDNRLDVSAPWFQQNPASNNFYSMQAYGVISGLADTLDSSSLLNASATSFQHEGFILFPTPQWAFQVGGDLLHGTNQPDTASLTDESQDRSRVLGRTAYNFGPFTLGAQFQWSENNSAFQPVTASAATLVSGNSSETVLIPTAGLLVSFSLESGKNPAVLRLGGSYSQALPPLKQTQHYDLNILGTPATVDKVISVDSYQSFGPEVYLEMPGSFEAALLDHLGNTSFSLGQTSSSSSIPNISPYNAGKETSNSFAGIFKWRFPVLISARGVLRLLQGAYLAIDSGQTLGYDSSGSTVTTNNSSDLQAGFGTGLEMEKDFTVGLQAGLEALTGTITPSAGSAQNANLFCYHLSLGGEKWLTPSWAYRLGIIFEDDFNGGDLPSQRPFYTVPPGARITSSTLTVGGGYKDSNFISDLRLWYGQPVIFDSPDPNDFATDIGVQLSLSVLFH
ncbi:MAG TPA: hypothetical protein VMV05_00305 [bacterium]|nr:hypothetical protein [bacterium]